jgi:hypothetical protein
MCSPIFDIFMTYTLIMRFFLFMMPRNIRSGYQYSEEKTAAIFRVKPYTTISTCLSLCMIATYATKKTQLIFSDDLLQIIWFTLDQIFHNMDTIKQF